MCCSSGNCQRCNPVGENLVTQSAWTRERPTTAGWYWWRDAETVWIFRIEQHPDIDSWCYREGHELRDLSDIEGGEWQPVPPPQD